MTDRVIKDRDYFRIATTEDGLSKLGMPQDKVTLVTIVNDLGNIIQLLPNKERDKLVAVSGFGSTPELYKEYEVVSIRDKTIVIELLKWYISNYCENSNSYSPRAIVHTDYEEEFKEVAEALGLDSVKLTEELF